MLGKEYLSILELTRGVYWVLDMGQDISISAIITIGLIFTIVIAYNKCFHLNKQGEYTE
jgi:hypothetical protein